MARTDDEKEDGIVPDSPAIVLGGVEYPVREPPNIRARAIRRAMAEYETGHGRTPVDESDQLESLIDVTLKLFSPEIEDDWDRISNTATDTERLNSMVVVRDVLSLPFQRLAGTAQPAPNRKTRRTKAKHSGPKSTTS